MNEWSYSLDGANHQKISEAELIEALKAGKLNGGTLVWNEGMDGWARVGDSSLAEYVVETAVCAASGRVMAKSEMLQYGNQWLDPAKKDGFVSGLMEDSQFGVPYLSDNSIVVPEVKAKWSKILIIASSIYGVFYGLFAVFLEQDADNPVMAMVNLLLLFVSMCISIPAIVLYCMWIYQISLNCHRIKGAPLQASPGMVVGWYFIPFANFWMPYPSLKELWQVSLDSELAGSGSNASIVSWWWGVWFFGGLISGIIGVIVGIAYGFRAGGGAEVGLWSVYLLLSTILSSCISLVACVLIVKIISRITAAHRAVISRSQ